MKKIEVKVLNSMWFPGATMAFLAKLTQRGHKISTMADLDKLRQECVEKTSGEFMENLAKLPHGTIQRFAPITVAIVGASRRFLMQARTHQVGVDYVSASCQYSDYSETTEDNFVVPYAIAERGGEAVKFYLEACSTAMASYKYITSITDNDTAGYAAPQGLRNVLIINANHEAWKNMISKRTCNRNTTETQYVFLKIWDALLKTTDGEHLFKHAGPTCVRYNRCEEGHMSCRRALFGDSEDYEMQDHKCSVPEAIMRAKFPLIFED